MTERLSADLTEYLEVARVAEEMKEAEEGWSNPPEPPQLGGTVFPYKAEHNPMSLDKLFHNPDNCYNCNSWGHSCSGTTSKDPWKTPGELSEGT